MHGVPFRRSAQVHRDHSTPHLGCAGRGRRVQSDGRGRAGERIRGCEARATEISDRFGSAMTIATSRSRPPSALDARESEHCSAVVA